MKTRKYTDAPKEIEEAMRASVPVSEKAALGDDWKSLPSGDTFPRGRSRGSRTQRGSAPLAETFRRVKVGRLQLDVPASTGEAYTLELVRYLKSFIKSHPIPS